MARAFHRCGPHHTRPASSAACRRSSGEDAEHAHDWLPIGYDPNAFNAAEATTAMRAWASGEHLRWHGLPEPLVDLVRGLRGEAWSQVSDWWAALGERMVIELDDEDARRAARPWLAVLDAVGAGAHLTAAGYLPPVVVEQVARSAGVADWWIGKANREDLTPPVAALRYNAEQVGLVRKIKRKLRPSGSKATCKARVPQGARCSTWQAAVETFTTVLAVPVRT